MQWLDEHLPGASPERRRLLRHASRTLIEQGHAPALERWGLGAALRGRVQLGVARKQLRINGRGVAHAGFDLAG